MNAHHLALKGHEIKLKILNYFCSFDEKSNKNKNNMIILRS